ncbi:hypothetical protein ALP19_200110 [Pseudomonas syringae pv. tomato]|nr:hypothetical protein ALP19_200110 [Pseudomonas syringae pv. tomato]
MQPQLSRITLKSPGKFFEYAADLQVKDTDERSPQATSLLTLPRKISLMVSTQIQRAR